MTGATITVDIDDDSVQASFRRLLELGGDASDVTEEIREALLISHQDRFDQQVDPDGEPWAPLSPAYKKQKEKKRPGKGILVYDEIMSLLVSEATDDEVRIGTGPQSKDYAAAQNFGYAPNNLTSRTFLGFSEQDQEEAVEILQEHINRLLSGI